MVLKAVEGISKEVVREFESELFPKLVSLVGDVYWKKESVGAGLETAV
jgi:hypothetical protein